MATTRRSLSSKITLATVSLTVLAMGTAGLIAFQLEGNGLERSTVRSLETMATMVAINVRAGMDFDDRQDVLAFLNSVLELPEVDAVAVVGGGDVPYASVGHADLPPAGFARPGRYQNGWLGVVPIAYRDEHGDNRTGQVIVRGSGAHIQEQLDSVLIGLLIAGAAAVLVLLLLTRILLRFLLAPIASLLRTTQLLQATQDFSQRAKMASNDEIGELVGSFNGMLDTVQDRDARLAASAENLERQVESRTEELRKALTAAERATRAKSTFLANMSHEIRTPLNAVLGMTDLALETDDPAEKREYLETVRSAGSNLLGVLNDILDFSKIESGKLDITRIDMDLETVVVESLRPLTARIQSKQLELLLLISPDVGTTYEFDDLRVRQILTNLVGNAIKFTDAGHVILRVSTVGEGDSEVVEFAVEDTGVGIPKDRLQAVFSPFTQADNTITRRYSGTGLGLTICHHLTQLMGGTITVESEVGKGSTFRLRLPMARTSMAPQRPPQLQAGLHVAAIAHGLQQEALAAAAARAGATFAVFEQAEALVAHIAGGTRVDFVVVDERDPDVDALITKNVPSQAGGCRPVVLLTSFQDLSSTIARCALSNYAGYLTKPMSPREFVHQLAAVVAPAATSTALSPGQATGDGVRPLRVLVAEDNPVNQKLVERLLTREGHEVTMTANGRECFKAWREHPFDILLLDMQMPEMSGIEAAQQIRAAEAGSGQHVPILALTANTSGEDRDACMLAGIDEMLSKPISAPRLRASIARFAGRQA